MLCCWHGGYLACFVIGTPWQSNQSEMPCCWLVAACACFVVRKLAKNLGHSVYLFGSKTIKVKAKCSINDEVVGFVCLVMRK